MRLHLKLFPNRYRNFTVFLMVVGLMAVINLSSCAKLKAKRTLKGTWKLTSYNLLFDNQCSNSKEYFNELYGDYGTITFKSKDVLETDYSLNPDSCVVPIVSNAQDGEWKILSHESSLLILHEYRVTIDGNEWMCVFGTGEKAHHQDLVTLQKGNALLGFDNFEYMVLERIGE